MREKHGKRVLGLALAFLMVVTLTAGIVPMAMAETPTFAITPEGSAVQGMPLFNGNPDDLEAYLDTLWDYYGVEGFAVHATEARNNSVGYYTLVKGENAGKRIISGHRAVDTNGGASTAIPSSAGFAHTWNPGLAEEVGTLYGNERLATINHAYNNLPGLQLNAYAVNTDIHVNQQCGRYYNGFGGEDVLLSVGLASRWAGGANGTLDPLSDDGFWLKHSIGTKHFGNHSSEYNRTSINMNTDARGLMEYAWLRGVTLAKTNTANGYMSSFGSTNGIPNVMAPIKKYVTGFNKWAQFSSPDMSAFNHMTNGNLHNGYQNYAGVLKDGAANGNAQTALIALTGNQGGASGGQLDNATPGNLWEAVYNPEFGGIWGVTAEDVKISGRDQLINIIRLGVFNERENYTNGRQLNWPFLELSGSGTANTNLKGEVMNYTNRTDHQAVVLRAAQEIPVLLRNDNDLLPIAKTSKVYTLGYKTSHNNNPQYAVGSHAAITNAALTPVNGMMRVGGTANVTNNTTVLTNGVVVAIKNGDGTYWYSESTSGNITAREKPADGVFTDNYLFSVLTYGQGTVWIHPVARITNSLTASNSNGSDVTNTGNVMSLTANTATSTLRIEEGVDGKYHLMVGNMANNSWTGYYNGRLLYNNDGNIQAYTAALTNINTAAAQRAMASTQFEFEVVDGGASDLATDGDYAVVYLGNNTLGLGEGSDRGGMDLGFAQYRLASDVAKKYPGKTIVVVASNEPLLINELKEDPNIGAIILSYYAGEFTNYGLAQCIYGDADFTGRTASSWYKTIEVFPMVDKYIARTSATFDVDSVDPRFKYNNLTQTSPETTRLTYMYADPDDVAYAFGAGLSYATFQYSNMSVGSPDAEGNINVTVTVKNTGDRASQEVLQLYASNPDSAYGDAAPLQKLVAFDKVSLAAGQFKTVTLTIDPLDISIWDTNADDYLLEDGNYNLYFGSDCYTANISTTLTVAKGNVIGTLRPETPINVFDRSFTNRYTNYREFSKENSIKGYRNGDPAEGYFVVMSLGKGSYTAIKNVQLNNDLDGVTAITASVGKIPAGASSIDVRIDAPDGPLYATIPVNQTEPRSYDTTTDGTPLHVTVQEIGFVDQTVALKKNVSGVHDLYFVFNGEDIRLNTIQLSYGIDKSFLAAAIADFEALDKVSFGGTGSWTAALAAYDAAVLVYDDAEALQGAVDQATENLLNAMGVIESAALTTSPGQPTTVYLRVKQTYQLKLDTTLTDLLFFSSNSANVTVSETGLLTGVRSGLSVITVRSASNPSKMINIVVNCTV